MRKIRKNRFLCITLVLMMMLTPITAFAEVKAIDLTPYQLTAVQMTEDETHPYGSVLLNFKIDNLPSDTGDSTLTWYVNIDKKIGDQEWINVSAIPSYDFITYQTVASNQYFFEQIWVEDYAWDGSTQISYRVQVVLEDLIGTRDEKSNYSNIASVGLISNEWAIPELLKAEEYGLIPDILKGADLTKPITREEFCELAILLYEKISGESTSPISPNPFTDTKNPQILKAFRLEITNGISSTTFEPNTKINREQCATMLFRTIKALDPNGDYTVRDFKNFADQKDINDWALDGVKYMSKLGIIKGDQSGKFMPKAMTSQQEAIGYGMATREAAIIMAVRTFEKLK